MKTILTIACIISLAASSGAQALQASQVQTDSLSQKYHSRKSAGIALLTIGGVSVVAGACVVLVTGLNDAFDYNYQEGQSSGTYIAGGVLFFAGAGMAILGATQLRAAHKIRKKMMNANLSLAPSYVPSLSSMGTTTKIPQSTISLSIPIGR